MSAAIERHRADLGITTEADARKLTDRIRQTGAMFLAGIEKAIETEAWTLLGYADSAAYFTAEFADLRVRLTSAERSAAVTKFIGTGLSNRQTAKALGVSEKTVRNDRSAEKSAPTPPRRRALPDQMRKAGYGILSSIERVEKLEGDDRFEQHLDQVEPFLRNAITRIDKIRAKSKPHVAIVSDLVDTVNGSVKLMQDVTVIDASVDAELAAELRMKLEWSVDRIRRVQELLTEVTERPAPTTAPDRLTVVTS